MSGVGKASLAKQVAVRTVFSENSPLGGVSIMVTFDDTPENQLGSGYS